MPLFSYQCRVCDNTSELLVMQSDNPRCPHCGSTVLERLISRPAPPSRSKGAIGAARSLAAREGHFSNYTRSERGKAKG